MSKRLKYDREFKISTVRLVLEGKQTMRDVAADLGVNYHTLVDWKREYEQKGSAAFPGAGRPVYTSEVEEELAKLRKENRKLKMERDILKKAMAISLNVR